MGGTGVSVVLLGLTQKLTHATAVFWGPENMGDTFFATWRYHANAGAFMNLVWPLLAAWTALAFLREEARWKKILLTTGLVICLAGLAVNRMTLGHLASLPDRAATAPTRRRPVRPRSAGSPRRPGRPAE